MLVGTQMKNLSLFNIDTTDYLIHPEDFTGTALTSPALELLSDFKYSQPTIIDAHTNAANALEIMQHEHSHLKLVINKDDEMIGLIHLDQLSDQAIMRRIANGERRSEISIMDLMTPRHKIKALAYQQLKASTIADVINTLQTSGELYCLVVDRETHQIRGVISAEEISKRLHIPVHVHKAPTFLNIFDYVQQ